METDGSGVWESGMLSLIISQSSGKPELYMDAGTLHLVTSSSSSRDGIDSLALECRKPHLKISAKRQHSVNECNLCMFILVKTVPAWSATETISTSNHGRRNNINDSGLHRSTFFVTIC
ncbi:unnamed protein product [Pleuronectes platessa]|uniref:Uncharacterized protein n=1 Tax=Pleuronectes platessa TaxID=8262 RepID=A0A9N7U7A9_PLEPL|nr:unnamed protein product [Pleuronectes platessa]